ncbi:MAG: hypothetical protein WD048_15170 [Chitinophagales bacterium]
MEVQIILEILKYILPALIVLLASYYTLKSVFENDSKKQELKLRYESRNEALPIRLNAYERLAVLMERLMPYNLIPRFSDPKISSKEMKLLLIKAVKEEFEHNLSQQIYVSRDVWNAIQFTKDDLLKHINIIHASIPEDSSSVDYGRELLNFYMKNERGIPNQRALTMINTEVKQLL